MLDYHRNLTLLKSDFDNGKRFTISIPPYPSAILKYRVEYVEDMFSCGSNNLVVDKNRGQISYELLGSMKEYWRQTENVYVKGHPKSNTDDKNRK